MAQDFQHGPGYSFSFAGTNIRSVADKLQPGKYPVAQNIRAYGDTSMRVRPGLVQIATSATGNPVESVRAYSTLETDNKPRYLFKCGSSIFLDSGTVADTGYSSGLGASLIPYRPNQSPQSWMYIGDSNQYRKIQAPDSTGAVVAQNVGIVEPQVPVDFGIGNSFFTPINVSGGVSYSRSGTAGVITDRVRTADTVVAVFQDPALPLGTLDEFTVQTQSATQTYQTGQFVSIGIPDVDIYQVKDVYPALVGTVTIAGVYYYAGNTGRCVVVPFNIGKTNNDGLTLAQQNTLTGVRRGALITLGNNGGGATATAVRLGGSIIAINVVSGGSSYTSATVNIVDPTGHGATAIAHISGGAVTSITVTNPGSGYTAPIIVITSGNQETCYVLGTATAPDGTISFEIITKNTHGAGEILTGQPAIKVLLSSEYQGTAPVPPIAGTAISAHFASYNSGGGISAVSSPISFPNPFSYQNVSFRPEDYIHISVICGPGIQFLLEIKLLLDISDGSFTKDYYYYTLRPSDIEAGISNNLSQLGVAQLSAQRETIDQEAALHGQTASSLENAAGLNAWSDIFIPISKLIRVGSDQTKSLINLGHFQILVNSIDSGLDFGFHTVDICGGFSPDVTESEPGYKYVIRPRSRLTGAVGNPSPEPRYEIRPRREEVQVILPTTYVDTQADTWDIFRVGGSLTAYTLAGSVPIGTANFLDDYADSDIASSEQLDYENFQPWPTVDVPLNAVTISSVGTTAIVTITDPTTQANVLRYLPGNLIQLGQQVYTLWTRPTSLGSDNYLFQFVENSGAATSGPVSIYEPTMANQVLPYLWGPTEQGGNLFGCGDPLRPGFVYYCKNFNPDSAPDSYTIELCPPSEPLLGGEVLNGNSYAASTDRWWQLRPSFGGESQYTPIEANVGRGLAAPFGHCTDGSRIYFVAKDGIYATSGGAGESLTDADLYQLFPHDGIAGKNHTYNGVTLYAPDYSRAQFFRLAYCNSYLYFDYQDSTGTPRTLIYDVRHAGWSTDVFADPITVHYAIEQQEGSLDGSNTLYGLLILGSNSGILYQEQDGVIDVNNPINWILATLETTEGDMRAQKLFGDMFLDLLNPAPASGTNPMTVTPMSLGQPVEGALAIANTATRQQLPLDLQGGLYAFSMGLFMQGTINVGVPTPPTFYTWQPSYIIKPETTATRAGDPDNCGISGAKWMQGFILEANTSNAIKQLGVRNLDDQVLQQVFPIQHNGQSEIAYSFTTPFVAHMVRYEPEDAVDWMFFGIRWVFEPTPETVTNWQTQGSAVGFDGYGHIYSLNIAYAATSQVTFTMTYDGQSQVFILPSTGGIYTKTFLSVSANKGKLYTFQFSTVPDVGKLQLWKNDLVIDAGTWGRTDAYRNYNTPGGISGPGALI